MSEHAVYINPRWLENPHDHQHIVGCTACRWRQETVTLEHAQLLAAKHLMGSSARGRRRG